MKSVFKLIGIVILTIVLCASLESCATTSRSTCNYQKMVKKRAKMHNKAYKRNKRQCKNWKNNYGL